MHYYIIKENENGHCKLTIMKVLPADDEAFKESYEAVIVGEGENMAAALQNFEARQQKSF